MRALLSVYDKAGLIELAKGLSELDVELLASGKTYKVLADNNIASREVATLTGIPEMLDGRVKTLHPAIHAGILADRNKASHMQDLEENGISPIDMVVCNLYPFPDSPGIEMIDVGGPTMVRAAAKNYECVTVIVDPADYGKVLQELKSCGVISFATRAKLARKAFAHTAAYDAAIVSWFDDTLCGDDKNTELPPTLHLSMAKTQELRYGENPHQLGARYSLIDSKASIFDTMVQLSGKELSYLNLFDAEAAWLLAHDIMGLAPDSKSGVAIIKHANPCGVAVGDNMYAAYESAYNADPMSAFGGIVAIPGNIDMELAEAIAANNLCDVLIAYQVEPDALAHIAGKRKNTRILTMSPPVRGRLSIRQLGSDFLVQQPDIFVSARPDFKVVTHLEPTDAQWNDLELVWRTCARTTSNAITIAKDGQVNGIGCGQQSRVDAAVLACKKAGDRAKGAVAASDAYFPFRDGLDVLVDAGVTAVIQPGGSLRDGEVISAANERNIAMVFTSERHFRH